MLKVNYFSHQMAITLAEKGFLEKTKKAEQETSIIWVCMDDYGPKTSITLVRADDYCEETAGPAAYSGA